MLCPLPRWIHQSVSSHSQTKIREIKCKWLDIKRAIALIVNFTFRGRGSSFLYMGGSTTSQTTRPSLFVVLLLKSLLSSSVTVYCSCECAYLLRRSFIISYTSTNSLLLCDQNSWFVTVQPASPILSEPAFKETISTVKEREETDKSESASSVLKVCDNVIINSLIAFLSGPTSSSDHNCIVVT